MNRNVPAKKARGRIFISKAVILLSLVKKSRDADHLQNLIYDRQIGVGAEEIEADLQAADREPIPDYAYYDCHTKTGVAGKDQGRFRPRTGSDIAELCATALSASAEPCNC